MEHGLNGSGGEPVKTTAETHPELVAAILARDPNLADEISTPEGLQRVLDTWRAENDRELTTPFDEERKSVPVDDLEFAVSSLKDQTGGRPLRDDEVMRVKQELERIEDERTRPADETEPQGDSNNA